MHIGQIPGYYYDDEKKKYFKVQANHVAPAGAKYSKSNVNREKRESKKRKLDEREQDARARQTVRPARIMQHPISGGVGLMREGGNREQIVDICDRDAFFTSQLKASRHDIRPPNGYSSTNGSLFDTTAVPGTSDRVFAYNHSGGSTVYVSPRLDPDPLSALELSIPLKMNPTVAFNSALVGLHALNNDEVPTMVVCTREPHASGNLYIGNAGHHDREVFRQDSILRLGTQQDSSLWASAVSPTSASLAVSGTEAVHLVDITAAKVTMRMTLEYESRAITWWDSRTVAFGERENVVLWDIRSRGRVVRFKRKKPITGIQSPDHYNGVHLLVADNRRMDLYDTRMEKAPLFVFKHLHQGPQLQFDCSTGGLVAALDANNDIQVYSLRTATLLSTLRRPPQASNSLLQNLRWAESGVLQACQDHSVVQWTFGGREDDEV